MQGTHWRKYGTETKIIFEVYDTDGVDLNDSWTPAAADCEVMKDEGAFAQCTNTAVDEGDGLYSITLTATEMQAARLVVKVVDAATKVILDKVIIVETYGNASAQHALDLDTALADATVGTVTTNSDMRGTDSAALASVCTEARLAELDAANLPADIAAILEDTGTTIPATLASILEDTGTTLPALIATIDGIVDAILEDTGTTLPASLAAIAGYLDTEVAAILEDTGTTLPALIAALETKVDTVDTVADGIQADLSNGTDGLGALKALIDTIDGIVDAILVDTGTTLPASLATAEGKIDVIDALADLIHAALFNKRVLDVDNSRWDLYNAAGDTVLYRWAALDKDGNAITAATGVITQIGVPEANP